MSGTPCRCAAAARPGTSDSVPTYDGSPTNTARADDDASAASTAVDGYALRQPGDVIDRRTYPHRLEPREHQAQQQGPVQRPGHDDLVAGRADREREGLVAMGGAADREPADVGPPQRRRPALGLEEQAVLELHGVHAAVQRDVAAHDLADEVGALLVSGDAERRPWRGKHGQIGVVDGGVAAEVAGVGVGHPAHASDRGTSESAGGGVRGGRGRAVRARAGRVHPGA